MKFALIVLAFVSNFAQAAVPWNPETAFDVGSKFLRDQITTRKIDYILNPIFCFEQGGNLTLIYSHDFRYSDDAYLVRNGSVRKVSTSRLGLVDLGQSGKNMDRDSFIESFALKLGSEKLLCVTSRMQLESVSPGR